jgi:hypothetical protein
VTLVRHDAPEDRVVAVGQVVPEGDDERPAPDDARLARQHRAASVVADGLHPRCDPHAVVEGEADSCGSRGQNGSVRRNRPNKGRVCPPCRGEGEAAEEDDQESADAQRFEKLARTRRTSRSSPEIT